MSAPMVKVHVYPDRWGMTYGLFANQEWNGDLMEFHLGSETPVKVEKGAVPIPLVHMDRAAAQVLLDQLWEAGLRPQAVMTADATNRAQAQHLEDMRTIAFAKLGIDPAFRERIKA